MSTACLVACGVCRSFPNLFVLSNVGRGGVCGSSKLKRVVKYSSCCVAFLLTVRFFFLLCITESAVFSSFCVRYVGSFDLPLHTC